MLEKQAKELAGNWRKFHSFAWSNQYELDNPDLWGIVYTHNRDSSLLDESNAEEIERRLSRYIARGDILPEHHNHWACGWIDGYAIKIFSTPRKNLKSLFSFDL